jgi:hypothetical protein
MTGQPAPLPRPAPVPRPSAVLAARYARALDIAAVVAVAGWHLAGAGPLLVAHLGSYPSDQFQIAAWCAIALIIAAGSVLLLRGSQSRGTGWALAAAALAISTAVAAACPPDQMLATDWAWGTAGWVGVLVLLRRPLAELGVFLTLEGVATFAVLARDGLHRSTVAAFITVLAGSAGIQLAIAVAAGALNVPARQAADATTREADVTARRAVADRIRGARRARWLELRATAEPLLQGLATGTADPGDPAVRRACAVEAARLRRLLAEGDDAPDPLVHELHACADVAQRRGVAVDIETAAVIPAVPPEGRRAITDLAIAVLVNAMSQVRVTVTGTVDGVIVSLVSDSPAEPDLPSSPVWLAVDSQRDQQSLWVEARWNTM